MAGVFDKTEYKNYWHNKDIRMLYKTFRSDIRCCKQRISKGYCEQDLWSIDQWFLDIMPNMLEEYKETRHGSPSCLGESYTDERGCVVNDACHEEWNKILEEMIFLFREADEVTCQKKNPFEQEWEQMFLEFEDKHGVFGEKLQTLEEKRESEVKGTMTLHTMQELPEYEETDIKYRREEELLQEYRDNCKDKAFGMFANWFRHLWD